MSTADKFRALTRQLQAEVVAAAQASLDEQADALVSLMKSVVPEQSGHLKDSIRKLPGKRPLQVRVAAGGELTTKEVRKGSGVAYDYAMAEEFGTRAETAKPFFWPSYRLSKKAIRAAVRGSIARAVKRRSSV